MNNYFKKINFELTEKINPGELLHNPNDQGLSYYKIAEEQYLKNIFKINFPYRIFYCIMTGPGKLYPHIDKHSLSSINYYINSGNGKTFFYEVPKGVLHRERERERKQ